MLDSNQQFDVTVYLTILNFVPRAGLEPARVHDPTEFKSVMSTYFIISANYSWTWLSLNQLYLYYYNLILSTLQYFYF